MTLTNAQAKLLNALPMGQWIKYSDITGARASSATVRALVSAGKLVAMNIAHPHIITDEDVESGTVRTNIRLFTEGDFYPHFIKKIAEAPIGIEAMDRIAALEEKIRQLEEGFISK